MQTIGIHSIEDCLEILTGLQKHNLKFEIDSSDSTIINSIARQVFKGTALTDRQYNLMKEKLLNYKDQFETQEVMGFDRALEKLRQPLRHIDRSKYIKIVSHSEMLGSDHIYESYKEDWKWIEIRFPFAKNTIIKINELAFLARDSYYHKKGSHKHFFQLKEQHVFNVIDKFINTEFEIQEELITLYNSIKDIQDKKYSFIPHIRDTDLCNLHPAGLELAKQELGNLSKDNLLKYIDRRSRYGITDFKVDLSEGNLSEKIATRESADILFPPAEYRLESILEAVHNLDRYPLLIVLTEKEANEQLYNIFNFLKHYIPSEEQSVLFRLEEKENEFNQLVKEYKLNNWVDKTTKVVYINNNKLPKICLSSDWRPIASLSFDSRCSRNVDSYISEFCDLIIYHDNEISPLRRYSRYYA